MAYDICESLLTLYFTYRLFFLYFNSLCHMLKKTVKHYYETLPQLAVCIFKVAITIRIMRNGFCKVGKCVPS